MQLKGDFEGFKGYQFGNFDVDVRGLDDYIHQLPSERQKYYQIWGDKLLITDVSEAADFMTRNNIRKP